MWVAADDAVGALRDFVVAGLLLRADAASPQGDTVLPDGLAVAHEGESVVALDDENRVGGGKT